MSDQAAATEVAPGKAVVSGLDEAVALVRKVTDHPDSLFFISLILGAAQDWIIEWLETVFYVIFTGGTGSGKSTAVRAAIAMTKNGDPLDP